MSKSPMKKHACGKAVASLLQHSTQDTDAVSIYVDGISWEICGGVVFVVRDKLLAKEIADDFAEQGYVDLKKGIASASA
jgi:hypothetical protein